MKIRDRFAKLIDIKSLTTLAMVGAFVYGFVDGRISAEIFVTIFSTVIAFYYGTQTTKKKEGE